MRIVSLAPGATDILVALGLGDAIVGIGHDSDVPPGWQSAHVVTARDGASTCLDEGRLVALAPDLIFARGNEDGGPTSRTAVRRSLARMGRHPPVYALAPRTVGDVLSDVKTVGDATGARAQARELLLALRSRLDRVTLRTAGVAVVPRVVCLEALDPPRTSGFWVSELIGMAGGYDTLGGVGRPSRPTSWAEVAARAPEVLVLLSRHSLGADRAVGSIGVTLPGWDILPSVRMGRVISVDAALFERPGPRIVDALETVAHQLHPDLFAGQISSIGPVLGTHSGKGVPGNSDRAQCSSLLPGSPSY